MRSAAISSAKTTQSEVHAPSLIQKCERSPGHIVNAPPSSNYWDKRHGVELARNLSDRNGAILEAGKEVLYTGMFT